MGMPGKIHEGIKKEKTDRQTDRTANKDREIKTGTHTKKGQTKLIVG